MARKPKAPAPLDEGDAVKPADGAARTVGEQPSGTPEGAIDPSTTRADDEPGGDVVVGGPDLRDEADMDDEEFERLDAQDPRRQARALRFQRPADYDPTVQAKIDPVDRLANVELPGPDEKVDNGSKERTDQVQQTTAERIEDEPGFAEGYAHAMKQARGEL